MSMYLRIKRKNQTIFLHVDPSDSFGSIKKQLAEISQVDATGIGLHAALDKSRELPDLATIGDQDIKNDAILYMVLKKAGGGDTWEEIDVASGQDHDSGGGAGSSAKK